MDDPKLELLHNWYKRIRTVQTGHYHDANRLKQLHLMLGIPVVVLSGIVGTGVFASLSEENPSASWRITLGLISISAAALASLQTFLNYSEQSARHLEAATKLSSLKKEIEENLVLLSPGTPEFDDFIRTVRAKWDAVTAEAPIISPKTFVKTARKYGSEQAFPAMKSRSFSESQDKI